MAAEGPQRTAGHRRRRSNSVPSLENALQMSRALERASARHLTAPVEGSPHWPRKSAIGRSNDAMQAALAAGRRRLVRHQLLDAVPGAADGHDLLAATFARAVSRGDLPALDALFCSGLGAYRVPGTGDTPLLLVAGVHELRAMKFLLAHRDCVDPDAANLAGERPLLLAAAAADEHAVRLLLQAGADPNAADDTGATPLIACAVCRAGDARQAVNNPSSEVARELLAAGADPWAVDARGMSALAFALAAGNRPLVRALLRHEPRLAEQQVLGVPLSRMNPAGVVGSSWARRGALLSLVWLASSRPALPEATPLLGLSKWLARAPEGVVRRVVLLL